MATRGTTPQLHSPRRHGQLSVLLSAGPNHQRATLPGARDRKKRERVCMKKKKVAWKRVKKRVAFSDTVQ